MNVITVNPNNCIECMKIRMASLSGTIGKGVTITKKTNIHVLFLCRNKNAQCYVVPMYEGMISKVVSSMSPKIVQ